MLHLHTLKINTPRRQPPDLPAQRPIIPPCRFVRLASKLRKSSYEGVGSFLVDSWGAKLRLEFPDREFVVRLFEADEHHELRISVRQASPTVVEPKGWDSRSRYLRDS
jgi:hypothetical protein